MRPLVFPAIVLIAASCRDFGVDSGPTTSSGTGGSRSNLGAGSSNADVGGNAGEHRGSEAGAATIDEGGTGGREEQPIVGAGTGGLPSKGTGGSLVGSGEDGGHGGVSDGDPEKAGGAGGESGNEEVTLIPSCLSTGLQNPPFAFRVASDVTATELQYGFPAVVFATQPDENVALVTWPYEGGSWVPWGCFDPLFHPRRIAATNLSNKFIEVYALADDGLHWRQLHSIGWSSWRSMATPGSGRPLDVAALGFPQASQTELYLAGESRLYRRQRVSSGAYASFGPWAALAHVRLRAVAPGRTPAGVRWIVGVGSNGELLVTSSQANNKVDLEPFGSVGNGAADVAAGYEPDLTLFFLAADIDGGLWRRTVSATIGEWALIKATNQPPKLTAISVASSPADAPLLFGVDEDGRVHRSSNGTTWILMD